ncbi:hypothetical protein MASR1M90_09070 [Desulfovibrionales bacterium]
MKVVHLCTIDFGGAAKAAYRLHKGLQSTGIDSTMLVVCKKLDDPSVKRVACTTVHQIKNQWPSLMQHWNNILTAYPNRPKGIEIFTDTFSSLNLLEINDIKEADIINLHWVAGMFDYKHAAQAFVGKKIVWTLHDMNPFTGGCHYAGTCTAYTSVCGACPQLGSADRDDLANHVFKIKAETYRKLDLTIVTPSKWLGSCSAGSTLFGRFRHEVIPNGFPLDTFKPMDRKTIRDHFSISDDTRVVLFGADSIVNQRKGFALLLKALAELSKMDCKHKLVLAVFGALQNSEKIPCAFPVLTFDFVSNENDLAALYNLADVFVVPSLEDNLPNTVVESLGCGTPVASFAIGGIPDMVDHKKTGYLAQPGNASDLATGIRWSLNEAPRQIRMACRNKAESFFALQTQAANYKKLYETQTQTKFRASRGHKGSVPKITIVTPSFNQAEYLEECIESILSQNYPNLEYIIMDGGSTDGSVEIIKKYEKHLTYWQSQPDGGQYAAINEGFRRSTGEIMGWLNSDDKLHPGALEKVAHIFTTKANVEWIMGRPNGLNPDGTQAWVFDYLPLWSREKYLVKEYRNPYIQQEGTFWRRTLWEKSGSYLRADLQMAADLELWTRFFRHAQLYTVDALLGAFRKQPHQKTANFLEVYHREAEYILDQERAFFIKESNKKLLPAPSPILCTLSK